MKINLSRTFGALLLAGTLTGVAHAGVINGEIDFAGSVTINGTNLANSTGAWFTNAFVTNTTGAFAGVPIPGSVTFADNSSVNVWSFNDAATITNFWSDAGFTFTLGSSTVITQNLGDLYVTGVGTLGDGTPADNTPGLWSFSVTDASNGQNGTIKFSFQSTTDGVPDGGTTALLLGAALVGMTVIFRRKVTQV